MDSSAFGPSGSGHVVATAEVTESADLWASNGKQADSYSTTYQASTGGGRSAGGCWWSPRVRGAPACIAAPDACPSAAPALLLTRLRLPSTHPLAQVEYMLVLSDGAWRIASALVLGK